MSVQAIATWKSSENNPTKRTIGYRKKVRCAPYHQSRDESERQPSQSRSTAQSRCSRVTLRVSGAQQVAPRTSGLESSGSSATHPARWAACHHPRAGATACAPPTPLPAVRHGQKNREKNRRWWCEVPMDVDAHVRRSSHPAASVTYARNGNPARALSGWILQTDEMHESLHQTTESADMARVEHHGGG
jgi:hypothetical protein